MSEPVAFLSDFPDRFSPMLVKELRQGMRAKTFIALFLSLQIFLAVMLFSAGAASTSSQVGSLISGIIFGFFSIAVLVVQPLRGTAALSSEVKGNTIDMMVLTRLSAWRIVLGKWVAIVGQSALLLTTIIPYLILRYFFGGMNLFGEIVCLILIFLTSMALTAVTVGLSGCNSVIIRSLIPLFGLPLMMYGLLVVTFEEVGGLSHLMEEFSLSSPDSRHVLAAYVGTAVYFGWSMLSLGASLIAPAAENHSLARRLIALILVTVLAALGLTRVISEVPAVLMIAVAAVPAIAIALTDSSLLVQTVCLPFVRRGLPGRIAGLILYPTWHSGILFAALLGAISLAGVFLTTSDLEMIDPLRLGGRGHSNGMWGVTESVVTLAMFGGLLFPAAWQVFLFRGEGQRVANYLLILVGSFVLMGVLEGMADAMNSGRFLWFFAWNPLVFIIMIEESRIDTSVILVGVLIVDLLLLLLLVGTALLAIKKASPVFQQASDTLKPAE